MKTTQYNERPSSVANIGEDIQGAARHNFNTYENAEEKKARLKRNKEGKAKVASLKEKMFQELTLQSFEDYVQESFLFRNSMTTPFDSVIEAIKKEKAALRALPYNERPPKRVEEFNKLVRSYNRTTKTLRYARHSDYYLQREIEKLRPKRKTKTVRQYGKKFGWSGLEGSSDGESLRTQVRGVQFGNSVPDSEREALLANLESELVKFSALLPSFDLSTIAFAFGARGKAGSCAHYEPTTETIQTNRNTIGAMIHELGHAVDYSLGKISNRLSQRGLDEYRQKIFEMKLQPSEARYYCSKVEIFARAFEAYIYEKGVFEEFFLVGPSKFWPELNDEMRSIMDEVFKELA